MKQVPQDNRIGAPVRGYLDCSPGYAANASVATANGPRAVRDLRPGDLLLTRDRGFVPLLVAMPLVGRQPSLSLGPDVLGPGMPKSTVQLAPGVRVVNLRDPVGTAPRLADLLSLPQVSIGGRVDMSVLMFEAPGVILIDGAWVQCPGPSARIIAAVLPHLSGDNRQLLVASFAYLRVPGSLPAVRLPMAEDQLDPTNLPRRAGYLH